jgi:hypothetical protein
MAGLNELINLVELQRRNQEGSNPLFALAEGVEQGFAEARALEQQQKIMLVAKLHLKNFLRPMQRKGEKYLIVKTT